MNKPNGASAGRDENQGEGNWTAAKAFDRDQKKFAESGKVEPAARDAERALDSAEAPEMKEAERIGRSHSHGEDPALNKKK
ncbi:MAG: hypothetical protein WDN25_24150 [Acetobacteraceae bacterium]